MEGAPHCVLISVEGALHCEVKVDQCGGCTTLRLISVEGAPHCEVKG